MTAGEQAQIKAMAALGGIFAAYAAEMSNALRRPSRQAQ
jgi:hypothetical protein